MQISEEQALAEHFPLRDTHHAHDFTGEREELQRVLRHPEISRSASLVRFLSFICERYFEDKTTEIREHSIAVIALGRKESTFDSQIDPIVRVTARALRKRLHDYYENEGKHDPIEIVIPLGRYIPQFLPRDLKASIATESPALDSLETAAVINDRRPEEAVVGLSDTVAISGELLASGTHEQTKSKRLWPWIVVSIAIAIPIIFYAGMVIGRRSQEKTNAQLESLKWGAPVWSDEFNGPAQQTPDPTKWTFDVGNQNSWGNHELETYCPAGPAVYKGCDPRHPNAFQDGEGHLVLRAQKDADGNWTSARITTRGLQNFQYGRIESRMKLPVGTGLWPAFWMLGANFDTAGWPAAGAVDIVENVGASVPNGLGPSVIRASLHAPGDTVGNSLRRDFRLPKGGRIDDGAFHTYGMIWSPGMIQFYVDDPANVFFIQNVSSVPEDRQWVFDHPFYLVMNLAVGGDWSGDPDNTTPTPSDIVVDYVRVYKIPSGAPNIEWNPMPVKSGSIASNKVTLHGEKGTGRVYLSCATEPASSICALESSTVDFTNSDVQQDTLTLSPDAIVHGAKVVAPPGTYKLTIIATTLNGDRSELSEPFEVTDSR